MTHIGTFEAGTTFSPAITLQDQDGSTVDLSTGGLAVVTLDMFRRGAVYVNDLGVNVTTAASGVVTPTFEAAATLLFPAGTFDVVISATMGGGAVRPWRGTMTIVRGAGL